jgi:hydrogenase maturation protease
MENDSKIFIIGAGNYYRSDDAVGLIVAESLRDKYRDQIVVKLGVADNSELLDLWTKYNYVFLIDAVKSDGSAGQIYRFDVNSEKLPEEVFTVYSTHSFSIPQAVELARSLDMLPDNLMIYGVEGKSFASGNEMSPEVQKASKELANRIAVEIDKILKT